MSDLTIRHRCVVRLFSLQLVLIVFACGFSAYASREHSSFEVLQAKYESLMQGVSAGEIPKDVGGEAKALWLSVRKDLVTINAEIETLKLEVVEHNGARQERALDQLIEKSEERARVLFGAIQSMEGLSIKHGYESQEIYLVPPAEQNVNVPESRGEKIESSTERELDISLELAPEDLSKGVME